MNEPIFTATQNRIIALVIKFKGVCELFPGVGGAKVISLEIVDLFISYKNPLAIGGSRDILFSCFSPEGPHSPPP